MAETSKSSPIYIGLLHHPVYNKNRELVTSAITNLDIHDIARTARSYNLDGYFIINPDKEQQTLAKSITRHWLEGHGSRYNYERGKALQLVEITDSLDETIDIIKKRHGTAPTLLATTASISDSLEDRRISFKMARQILSDSQTPYLILFGTGWGMAETVLRKSDYIMEPVRCAGDYNHLSVRAAAAIIIDRLLSKEYC